MPDDALPDAAERLECGCLPTQPVCAHHRRLVEYARAFDPSSEPSHLPDLVLRPTLRTWLSEFDTFRTVLLALLVVGVPILTVTAGATVRFALGELAVFLTPIALFLLTFPNRRITLDPRARTVHVRDWRRKTTHLVVDGSMRAKGFRYVELPVTAQAVNVVLWTPDAAVRLDQRIWGLDQLDDLVLVLGVPVGGAYSDQDVEEMFPGTTPLIARRPKTFAAVILVSVLVAVIGFGVAVAVLRADEPAARGTDEPSQAERNGARPTSMPVEVASRQDALDASLRKVLGDASWVTTSTIHRCDEQPGWQREVVHSLLQGGRAPSDRLAASFTTTIEKAGLSVEESTLTGDRLVVAQYADDTGAGLRVYVTGSESPAASIYSNSECVVTPS